ncbi:GvpL/GvpF family gas vesicle protein [Terrabacter sp. NPDC080008]|uniref:GvpL/GvpF family gas vesicle protein n=1 Tax=Terrabacter sp. NPDC080008 TaxID=3155176 RepID=UPI0034508D58
MAPTPRAPEVAQPPTPHTATARYLYAVCRGLADDALAHVRGIEGEPLDLVHHEDLVAVVSTVPLASFDAEGLRRHLEDLEWLEATARAHDEVIQAAAGQAPTAPLRFATICFDDDGVRARLREWYAALSGALDRVEGCSEWSVKVLAPPEEQPVTGRPAGLTGAEYLRLRKAQTMRRAGADEQAAASASEIHDALARLSRASRRLPAQDPRLSGHRGAMLLNAAYLVAATDADAFEAALAGLRSDHGDVVVDGRGPWPPYSFAMLDEP